ncbi:ABC multidrug transporter mdr1 [Colletotrichum karsti]|uniref:ABC multidrug transporter mdr1 n=1 Tax=Colletotrichum karsti TaxID=1095194 RepID=A0A9P6IG97_9PEZI|nr:ABC multidrug transporter mdr1 [Colletotrichum karsti]KAF9882260.1 ABC multidrug transporter mdr1 [Colletotrichum karsti]
MATPAGGTADAAAAPGPGPAAGGAVPVDPNAPAPEPKRSWWKLSSKNVATLRNFIRIISYGKWYDKLIILMSVLGAIGAGLTMPVMNIVFGQLVGTFTGFFKQGTQETQEEFTRTVNQGVLYIVYLFIARLILTYLSNLGFRMTSIRISAAIRLAYLRSLFSLPISMLDMLAPGSTAAIITITASILQLGISEKIGIFFSSLSTVIAGFTIAFAYNWLLTLTTASGLVFILFVYMFTTPPIIKRLNDVQNMDIAAASVATEAFSANRMLAACGAEFKMMAKYGFLADESRQRGAGMAWLIAFQQGLIFFGIYATFALSFWYAFKMYTMMVLTTPASLIVVLLCIMMMASSIGQLTAPLSAASQAADANAVFHTIIDAPKPTYGKLKGPEASAEGDIVFQNVNFVYPKRPDVKILDNLNLTFPAGKVTAIVGPSGSGKSTIVGILERWYEFNGDLQNNQLVLWLRNGIISCGGRLISEIDPCWWRNQIGLVQQDNALFNTTIYKNVEYGLIGTEWENEDESVKAKLIEQACKDAFADEYISRLPDGYQTEVGDAGIKLSGGQRQRLAIARAIVKQPKILILDEATSAIDVRSEQIVQAALDRACRGRTTIVIAHRLGTIKKADNIILLRKGQVVQQGTHSELMAQIDGPYHVLATAQKLDMGAEEDDDILFGDLSWRRPEPEYASIPKTFGSSEGDLTEKRNSIEGSSGDSNPVTERDGSDEELGAAGSVRVIKAPRSLYARWKAWHFFGSFGQLLGEQQKRWKTYIIIAVAALGAGASTPVQAYLFAVLVSLFSYWGTFLRVIANHWCLMFVYLAAGVGVSHFLLGYATTTIGFGITRVYRKEYFRNIIHKPAAFFDAEGNSAGSLTARLATDPTMLQQLLGTNMAFVLISLFNVIGCIVVGLVFGWKLTLVALGTSMPIIIAAMFYRVRHETKFEEANNAVFAESAKFASESIGAIRTVSSLTMEEGICERYNQLLNDHTQDAFRKSRFSVMVFAFSDSISLLCMAFVLWYGGRLLSGHEYTPFQYMVVYIAVVQGGMSAGQWLSFGPNIAKAKTAADRILAMRENDEDEITPTGRISDVVPYEVHYEKGVEIDFKDVWFSYPTRPTPVLKGLDLHIERGQFAAIVGPSGSGKTTIISLLERFYTTREGVVSYNGHDINTLDLAKYRQNISLVAQEPSLFTGSIRENILLGIEDEDSVSDEALHAAAKDAGIHEFVMSLPEGYNTAVGQSGVALSGGQKQRVSIARALIRRPSLLLLDEATSSLDSETERAVQAVFDATKGSRTMIMVAHRLATVQNADVIFVMQDGKVIEKGDHAALIAERGVYYQMCQSQALDK